MNNNSINKFVSNLKKIQKNIGNLETKYHNANVDILKKRLNSKKMSNKIIAKNKEISTTKIELQNKINACKSEEEAIKKQVGDITASLNSLKAAENSFNSNLQAIEANKKRLENEMNERKMKIKMIRKRLNDQGPPPPGPGPGPTPRNNNNRRPVPSTPSQQFALAANATLAKNKLNQSMKKKKNPVITQPVVSTSQSVKQQVKNWERQGNVKSSLNRLANQSPTKTSNAIRSAGRRVGKVAGKVTNFIGKLLPDQRKQIANSNSKIQSQLPPVKTGKFKTAATVPVAIERMKPKRTQVQVAGPPLLAQAEVINHSNAVTQKQKNAKELLEERRSYANTTRTNPVQQQPEPAPAVRTSTSTKGTSAINKLRPLAGQAMIAPMRRTQVNRPGSAYGQRGNDSKNPTSLILGQFNPHQNLMKKASGLTGAALGMPGYGKQSNGSKKTGAGTKVVQQAWGSRPRTSVTNATTATSVGKQTSRSPRAGQQLTAGSGTGGGNSRGFWKRKRTVSASLPSTPRNSVSRRPASAPSTPTGRRSFKAKKPAARAQVGQRR